MAIFNLQRAWRTGDNARLVADIYLTRSPLNPLLLIIVFPQHHLEIPLKSISSWLPPQRKKLDVVTTIVITGKVRTHALLAWMLVVDQQD